MADFYPRVSFATVIIPASILTVFRFGAAGLPRGASIAECGCSNNRARLSYTVTSAYRDHPGPGLHFGYIVEAYHREKAWNIV